MNNDTKPLNKVIHIDENQIKDHLGELVRGSVEDTLNALLDAEADRMCNANVTNTHRTEWIHVEAITSAVFTLKPVKSN